jgi:hypothetical protein
MLPSLTSNPSVGRSPSGISPGGSRRDLAESGRVAQRVERSGGANAAALLLAARAQITTRGRWLFTTPAAAAFDFVSALATAVALTAFEAITATRAALPRTPRRARWQARRRLRGRRGTSAYGSPGERADRGAQAVRGVLFELGTGPVGDLLAVGGADPHTVDLVGGGVEADRAAAVVVGDRALVPLAGVLVGGLAQLAVLAAAGDQRVGEPGELCVWGGGERVGVGAVDLDAVDDDRCPRAVVGLGRAGQCASVLENDRELQGALVERLGGCGHPVLLSVDDGRRQIGADRFGQVWRRVAFSRLRGCRARVTSRPR